MTSALVFSQSDMRKCFMYIFDIGNNMISSALCVNRHQQIFQRQQGCTRVVLHEKCTRFQPIRPRNFFMYINTRR